jgi:hypothetical protein
MKRKAYAGALAFSCLLLMLLPGCSSSSGGGTKSTGETIAVSSGSQQTANINAAFTNPIVATVTTNGSATSGVTVTFTAPASGASAAFTGGKSTVTATTNASGQASATLTANGSVGSYSVAATAPGATGTANFQLMNTSAGTISATNGIQQSTPIDSAFPLQLTANVMIGGTAAMGVAVTFSAPSSGASGTFAGGTNVVTATTDNNGNANATLTANGTAGGPYTVTATATSAGIAGVADFTMTNLPSSQVTISPTGGSTPQSAAVNTAFAKPLQATITGGSNVSGIQVTFTAPSANASGKFANNQTTETDTTNASGVATSSTFTANGTYGAYTVTATAAGISGTATYSLTNTTSLAGATLFSFYLSGLESINTGPNFYALAGSVAIDANGTVIAGEQDYNDGFGFTSPQPAGDQISGGSLTVNAATGQGTLTLNTNNTNLGVNGIETLGVQFVNAKHALIVQFDGSATSSGSMDFQTLPSTLSGGYAFTLSGVDASSYSSVVYGGVFTITGNTLQGVYDADDLGSSGTTPTLGTAFTATISTADEFGRGTILGSGIANTLNYYIVGPEAIRVIDVDNVAGVIGDSAIGSAFGQGTTTFTNSSLGTSVFALESNEFELNFAAAGMFTTASGTFSGVGDDNEVANGVQIDTGAAIAGTYSISNTVGSTTYNGYGSFTINAADLGDISVLGIYLTDPNLNLSDPNNTATGLGGALLADLDGFDLNGTGIVVPQTDTSSASFTSTYVFGAQELNSNVAGWEFDFAGQGTVTTLALSGSGFVSDPWSFFTNTAVCTAPGTPAGCGTDSGVTFTGTSVADGSNPGRYTLPLGTSLTVTAGDDTPFNVVVYQASGGELFWLEVDADSVVLGSLEQQGSLSGIPAVRTGRVGLEDKRK